MPDREPQRQFWHRRLQPPPPALAVPADRVRNSGGPGPSARIERYLGDNLRQSVVNLSDLAGVSVSTTLVAAVGACLFRHSGIDDLLLGYVFTESDGRHDSVVRAEARRRLLPLRVAVSGDRPFREWLACVDQRLREGVIHGGLAPTEILDLLSTGNEPRTPLLPVILTMSPVAASADASESAACGLEQIDDRLGMRDLTFVLPENAERIVLRLDFNTDLFDRGTADRLLGHVCTMLASATATPDAPLSELPILEADERRTLLVDWNSTSAPASPEPSISRRYERQSAATPDRRAITCGEQHLTYGELNARANRLARHLQCRDVGRGSRVGICLPRSPAAVEAILAALKAGAAYVPLDPVYPRDRLQFIARSAGLNLLVTEGDTARHLSGTIDCIVRLDSDAGEIEQHSSTDLRDSASPDDEAYIMYTSGSTGEPRGVVVTHSNLCHYVDAIRVPLALTADDAYLHTASFSFSSSVRQLFVPLSHGATVVLATHAQIRDPLVLFGLIKQRAVTVLDVVPSYWRTATRAVSGLDEAARRQLLDNRLRLLLSASEPLLADLPRTWANDLQPDITLLNMFGQTETTGIVACHRIDGGAAPSLEVVPAGRPIPGTRIYVLDRHFQPTPIGVAGEIVVGGTGIARGYLNQEALTADKFIRDPFADDPAARLYCTGDLGRFRADGTLEIVGRMDDQVKIRGARVELGEVEALLAQSPDVSEAVVVKRRGADGDPALAAFVVTTSSAASIAAVRTFVSQKLPSYMVPAAFVALPALPRTPNGKVDRHALAAMATTSARRTELVAARDPLECQLTRIWEELLGVQPVGIHDDFYELGGHSLLAVHLLDRLERLSGRRWAPEVLAKGATVERVAGLIRATRHDRGWSMAELRRRLAWHTR